jgi:hypothetical protein
VKLFPGIGITFHARYKSDANSSGYFGISILEYQYMYRILFFISWCGNVRNYFETLSRKEESITCRQVVYFWEVLNKPDFHEQSKTTLRTAFERLFNTSQPFRLRTHTNPRKLFPGIGIT